MRKISHLCQLGDLLAELVEHLVGHDMAGWVMVAAHPRLPVHGGRAAALPVPPRGRRLAPAPARHHPLSVALYICL